MVESDETFTLTITQLPQCNIARGQSSTNVTILDDDGKATKLWE